VCRSFAQVVGEVDDPIDLKVSATAQFRESSSKFIDKGPISRSPTSYREYFLKTKELDLAERRGVRIGWLTKLLDENL